MISLSSLQLSPHDITVFQHLNAKWARHLCLNNLSQVCKSGREEEALDIACSILQECTRRKDLKCGRHVQSIITEYGLDSYSLLSEQFIRLFSFCGFFVEANQSFNKSLFPNLSTWGTLISAYARFGPVETAHELCHRMSLSWDLDNYIYLAYLKVCSRRLSALSDGRLIHERIIQNGLLLDLVIGNTLLDMYAKCGSLDEARRVFDNFQNPDVVTWNALISGYAQHDEAILALECFEHMQHNGMKPDRITFSSSLRACGCLGWIAKGRFIHERIIEAKLQSNIVVGNTLVDMYVKCEKLEEASNNFNKLPSRDTISWNAIISGHAQNGSILLSSQCFDKMHFEGLKPSKVTFLSMLKVCGAVADIEQGRLMYEKIMESGIEFDVVLCSTLVNMFVKCGSLYEAHNVFHRMQKRNLVLFNAMIFGYAQHGEGLLALNMVSNMQYEDVIPDKLTFLGILKACGTAKVLEQGRCIHEQILQSGLQLDVVLRNILIDMYSRCGSLKEARLVFNKMQKPDLVSWNAMITGYAQHGDALQALDLFSAMQIRGIMQDKVTFLSTLKAAGSIQNIALSRQVHEQVLKSGFQVDITVANSLVDMYAKCGSFLEAQRAFNAILNQDMVSWNVMIAAYAQHREGLLALECFNNMQLQGLKQDAMTFSSILKACGSIGDIEHGRYIHEQTIVWDFQFNLHVSNTLIDMYAKCGSLGEACNVFDKLLNPDLVSWNTMVDGYALHGEGFLALQCFDDLQCKGVELDRMTFLSALKGCSSTGTIEQGRRIHEQVIDYAFHTDPEIGSRIIDMYGECGSLEEARQIFDNAPIRNVVAWNAIIAGYAQHGNVNLAIHYMESMQYDGTKPDGITYLAILTTCSHAGLVDEARVYFHSMIECDGITPGVLHYNCMIDLLGRSTCFKDAEELLKDKMQSNVVGLMTLLSACRMLGNVELGRRCFEEIACQGS